MHISDILRQDEYTGVPANTAVSFDRLETDPNKITKTTLFFLLRGIQHDEKRTLPFVLAKKPAALVTEEMPKDPVCIPVLLVRDVRAAFAFACFRFHKLENMEILLIGVSGTNGKTTVTTEICRLLEASGKKVGYFGTGKITLCGKTLSAPYYSMTTPDPEVLYSCMEAMVYQGCDAIVMEVSSHALALKKVAPLHFSYAVFLGLSEEHMDFHTDMESYYQTKKSLYEKADLSFLNVDDAYGARLFDELQTPKKSVGTKKSADIRAALIQAKGLSGSDFLYESADSIFPLSIPLAGEYQVTNALLAVGVCQAMGVKAETVIKTLKTMKYIPGRMEKMADSPSVYLDYAHTPKALESALEILYSNKMVGQKIILVFGCGGERDRQKRPLMAKASEKYADFFYITSDNSRSEKPLQIFKDIESGCQKSNHKSVYKRERAIQMAIENADDFDIVLIEGKGDEPYIKDATGTHPYNERAVIENAIRKKKEGRTVS